MQELDDIGLLREYVAHDSEEAFAALVLRHVNKVYSVALRHTGNPHQAEEITQAVFVILARKARNLSSRVILAGWLYQTARLTAMTFIRSEIRRAHREHEAHMQTMLNETESDIWPQIAPLLDTAMAGLKETERHAVVLRFFDGKSMREVGAALGTGEDAAKMRVNRAVEKLRLFFMRRGVVLPAAILVAAISANSVQAAPAVLAKAATAVAIAKGATASGSTLTLIKGALKVMAWTKAKTAILGVAVMLFAAGTATVVVVKGRQAWNQRQAMAEQTGVIKTTVIPAIIKFAQTHQDEIPASLTELKPFLPVNLAGIDDNHWQISASGKLTPIFMRSDIILLEQKQAAPGGPKIIVYADGHIEWKR